MSTHNLCFEQKYEEYKNFLSENFHFLEVKFSIYLNRHNGSSGLLLSIVLITYLNYLPFVVNTGLQFGIN